MFPQLFLGKHGLPRASRLFVKPSDNADLARSSHEPFRLGVRYTVNVSEHPLSVVKRKDPDESADRSLLAAQPGVPVSAVTARRSSSGSTWLSALGMNLWCLDKRQSVVSKVTSCRSSRAVYPSGRLTGNGMPMAAGVRDEEEANASGNAEDRVVPSPPCQGAGTHPSCA